MYHIPPLFILDNVVPANIMYNLKSYHEKNNFATNVNDSICNNNANNNDESEFQRILCEQKTIINQLIKLETDFKDLNLQNFSFEITNNTKTKQDAENKKQVKKNQLTIEPTFELSSNMLNKKKIKVFLVQNYGFLNAQKEIKEKMTLKCNKNDLIWVQLLKLIGSKRNVFFVEENKKNNKIDGLLIEVGSNEKKVLLKNSKTIVKGKLEVWKFVGALLGLYSNVDSNINANSEYWLNIAKQHTVINDDLLRQLSRFLSTNYFLCTCNTVCLADVIIRTLFIKNNFLTQWTDVIAANNVQLWVKRVDESLESL